MNKARISDLLLFNFVLMIPAHTIKTDKDTKSSKITGDGTAVMKLKDTCSLEGKL